MMHAFGYLFAATVTLEGVIIEAQVTESCLQFKIEMLRKYESKTVSDAGSISITLITLVCQNRKICSQE